MTAAADEVSEEVKYRTKLLFAVDRLLRRCVEGENGCVEWTGCLNSRGYGVIEFYGTRVLTHRLSYEAHVELIPEGLTIDHLCRNKVCVNPNHLEPVTNAENQRRAGEARTHCKHGHEYTPENTITKKRANGGTIRNCRTCNNSQQRARAFYRTYLGRRATPAEMTEWVAADAEREDVS